MGGEDKNKLKVLIIEDDAFLLGLYSDKFAQNGFKVYAAKDGLEGLRLFRQVKPDVVIVDLNIPELGGVETLKVMHQDPQANNACFIVFTNYDRDTLSAEENEAVDKIVKEYLLKIDITPDELVAKVKQLCQKKLLSNNYANNSKHNT